jgi:alginate O-acetyltransferase complex protein AlgI
MDAQAFLDVRRRPRRPPLSAWLVSAGQTLFGVGLIWGLVRAVPGQFELLQGWVGLVGLAFLLHFGSFQLIALFWQRVAIDAQPIMDSPLRAHSLGEFWGARWNSAFRHLSHALVYLPLREQIGSRPAVLAAFVASGLVHELVISLPAGAGFGLPTAYFLIQALGVLLERSSMTGRWRRPTPALGRAFALACSAAPAMVLFHPAFVRRVVLPFMAAIGAL